MTGTEQWIDLDPNEERLCTPDQLEDLILKAYERGWKASRWWPNATRVPELTIRWRKSGREVHPTITESPRQ